MKNYSFSLGNDSTKLFLEESTVNRWMAFFQSTQPWSRPASSYWFRWLPSSWWCTANRFLINDITENIQRFTVAGYQMPRRLAMSIGLIILAFFVIRVTRIFYVASLDLIDHAPEYYHNLDALLDRIPDSFWASSGFLLWPQTIFQPMFPLWWSTSHISSANRSWF